MPSKSRSTLADNATDLDRLHEIHLHEAGQGAGRKYHVEALNKAAVVFTCAAWEAFCEDLVREAIEHIVEDCSDPAKVPPLLRTMISEGIKKEPHAHSAWRMAGIGWRTVPPGERRQGDHAAHRPLEYAEGSAGPGSIQGLSWSRGCDRIMALEKEPRATHKRHSRRVRQPPRGNRSSPSDHQGGPQVGGCWHVSRLADYLDTDVGSLLASVTGKSYW